MPDSKENTVTKTFDRDSVSNTLMIAIGLSLVCSILVAGAAITLKPLQEQNELRFRQRIILDVAGLSGPGTDVESGLEQIEARMVELASGEYVDSISVENFDAIDAANDPETGVAIPPDADIARLRRRAIYSPVYLVRDGDRLEQIILPVRGAGLWSTLHGYLSLAPDGKTVRGLKFYDHGETPGLGDQIEDPVWQAKWLGKQLYDDSGAPIIEVIRGNVAPDDPAADYRIDGLSGATLTARGVTNLVRYWTGPDGFGPYLQRFSESSGGSS